MVDSWYNHLRKEAIYTIPDYNRISSKHYVFTSNGPIVSIVGLDEYWDGRIRIGTDSALEVHEKYALVLALNSLKEYFRQHGENTIRPLLRTTICLIRDDTISIKAASSHSGPFIAVTNGMECSLIVCYLSSWKETRLSIAQMAAVIIEEICHYAYDITDENLVKKRVIEILQCSGVSGISFESIFGISL